MIPIELKETELDILLAMAKRAKIAMANRIPDEHDALLNLFDLWLRLKDLGWEDANYPPSARTRVLMIEMGSTGIHTGYKDEIGWWVESANDLYPSDPILFKRIKE